MQKQQEVSTFGCVQGEGPRKLSTRRRGSLLMVKTKVIMQSSCGVHMGLCLKTISAQTVSDTTPCIPEDLARWMQTSWFGLDDFVGWEFCEKEGSLQKWARLLIRNWPLEVGKATSASSSGSGQRSFNWGWRSDDSRCYISSFWLLWE
jgi:hypothetical protein